MDRTYYLVAVVAVAALVTFAIRAAPFSASRWLARQRWVNALGDFLPLGVMAILCLHCLTQTAVSYEGGGLLEIGVVAVTIVLQWFKRDALLSILVAAILYVVLRNGLLF